MKRSEMIKKIILEFNGLVDSQKDSSQYAVAYNDSNKLLNFLEAAGMLPPETDKMIEGHLCSVNEWEPETTTCKDCGSITEPGIGSARCKDCWNSRFGEE